jgi:hypothetical protein
MLNLILVCCRDSTNHLRTHFDLALFSPRLQGMCYKWGDGVPKDESKALCWWTAAAAQGRSPAQYNLGTTRSIVFFV